MEKGRKMDVKQNATNSYWEFKQKLAYVVILVIILLSLPSKVKCDTGETISSVILIVLIVLFSCAGIGWFSKRNEAQL